MPRGCSSAHCEDTKLLSLTTGRSNHPTYSSLQIISTAKYAIVITNDAVTVGRETARIAAGHIPTDSKVRAVTVAYTPKSTLSFRIKWRHYRSSRAIRVSSTPSPSRPMASSWRQVRRTRQCRPGTRLQERNYRSSRSMLILVRSRFLAMGLT
jgi:hypothetical protein